MKRLIIILYFIVTNNTFGQLASHIRIKPEDIAVALELQKKFPKSDYGSLSTVSTYTFNYVPRTKKVEASLRYNETIIGLKEGKSYQNTVWYNDESFVTSPTGRNYHNKEKYISNSRTSSGSDGIFYSDAKVLRYSFNLQTRGDKTTYSYENEYSDIKYLTKAFFQSHYPMKEKKIIFEIPKWLTLDFLEVNFEGYNISKSEAFNSKKKVNVVTYTFNNSKPIISSDYSASWSASLPHILILAKKYNSKGKDFNLLSDTKDLYDWYASLIKEVENKPEDLEDLVTEITANTKSDEDKVKKIFYWVQDNIRYIAFENGIMGFKPDNANNVCKKKYGDCKGMANLTAEMLKIAGFDARLTWIGTRSIPYTYATPSLAVDNHMITTLFLNDKKYYLDATEKGVAFKDYAHRIQGQDVLIENKDSFIIDKVPEFDAKHNEKKVTIDYVIDGNRLLGKGENTYNGKEKTSLYRDIGYVAKIDLEERVKSFLAKRDKNNTISNLNITNATDRNLPIKFKYNIKTLNHLISVSNETYISLELDHDFEKITTEEDRIIDMDFGGKYYKNQTITLKTPENTKVDYLPKSILVSNNEFIFDLNYSFDETKRTIIYNKKITLKTGVISDSNFKVWNETIKKIKTFYNDQIIIIKN
tara:strand:- start:317 stop:2248 length:1932 start_codon:yes stop_codon:yes gene_type:complete